MTMGRYNVGTEVEWNWVNGTGTGKVKEVFTGEVERTIKGSKIKRNASADEPAYLIEQEDGDRVLKSRSDHSERRKKSYPGRHHHWGDHPRATLSFGSCSSLRGDCSEA